MISIHFYMIVKSCIRNYKNEFFKIFKVFNYNEDFHLKATSRLNYLF